MQAPPNFRLHFRYAYTIIYAMKNKSSKKVRSRAEILAEIAALPPSIQGTISSYKCPRKNGPPAVYYNLQYTLNGRNLFSLHFLDVQAKDRLPPRVHVGQACGKASWESLVRKTRGKTIDPLIHAADCVTLLLPLWRKAQVHAHIQDEDLLP